MIHNVIVDSDGAMFKAVNNPGSLCSKCALVLKDKLCVGIQYCMPNDRIDDTSVIYKKHYEPTTEQLSKYAKTRF